MRLFKAELKRIVKSRSTLIIFAVSIVLSTVLALIPILMASADVEESGGNVKELNGVSAIKYLKEIRSVSNGEVTPEKLKSALKIYQECVKEYGPIDGEEFPKNIYLEKISPNMGLYMLISDAYFKCYRGGQGGSSELIKLENIDLNELDHFYETCAKGVDGFCVMENMSESTRKKAVKLYAKVDTPFVLNNGYGMEAPDYLGMAIFILVILGVILVAGTFSDGYETGSDQILRCTKLGRKQLALSRILSTTMVCSAIFLASTTIHVIISDLCYGMETVESSVQTLSNTGALINMNIFELQIALVTGGLLSLIAVCGMTFFISSRCEHTSVTLSSSLILTLVPTFLFAAFGNTWIQALLPASGVGFADTGLYAGLLKYRFLEIGRHSFWNPYVTMISTLLWILPLMVLSARSYCKHQVK